MNLLNLAAALILIIATDSFSIAKAAVPPSIRVQPFAKGRNRVTFTFSDPGATSAFLAGTFNGWNWQQAPMQRTGSAFSRTINLPDGEYRYRFVLNNGARSVPDPLNPTRLPDGQGGFYNVLKLGEARNDVVSPDTVEFLRRDGWLWKYAGSRDSEKRAEAVRRLESVSRLFPDDPLLVEMRLTFFCFYATPLDPVQAAHELDQALKRGVSVPAYRRGIVLHQVGRLDEALRAILEADQSFANDIVPILEKLGQLYAAFSSASPPDRARVDDLLARLKRAEPGRQDQRLRAQIVVADSLLDMGALQEGVTVLNRAYSQAVSTGNLPESLGRTLLRMGDLSRAREVTARLLQSKPAEGERMQALLAVEIEDWPSAAVAARKIVDSNLKNERRADPELQEFGTILAIALGNQGKADDARKIAEQLPLQVAADASSLNGIEGCLSARLRIARALKDAESAKAAAEGLYQAISVRRGRSGQDDVDSGLLAETAVALQECGHPEPAKALARIVLADTPDVSLPHNQIALGSACRILSDEVRAVEHFRKATALLPGNRSAERELGAH